MHAAAADTEDISAKTGNYKKFAVFVRMLLSAIRQESESVFAKRGQAKQPSNAPFRRITSVI